MLELEWPVDKIEVNIFELKVLQLALKHWLDVLRLVVGVPKLGCDPVLITVMILKELGKCFTNLNLILINVSTINVGIALI